MQVYKSSSTWLNLLIYRLFNVCSVGVYVFFVKYIINIIINLLLLLYYILYTIYYNILYIEKKIFLKKTCIMYTKHRK